MEGTLDRAGNGVRISGYYWESLAAFCPFDAPFSVCWQINPIGIAVASSGLIWVIYWESPGFSGRFNVNTAVSKILLSALLVCALTSSAALAQNRDVEFHWSASPIIDGDGIVRPEAVSYEVWLRKGDENDRLVATVPDTAIVLNAEPGITQQIRVRGIDKEGRKSAMSEWSDPFYFESDGDVVSVPMGAQLKSNYPNPFNPETRIVYGVPDDIKSTDVTRLEIFSVQGHRVRTLEIDRSPGWHEVTWDGRDERGVVASAGMYVTRFVVGKSVKTGKMTMVK